MFEFYNLFIKPWFEYIIPGFYCFEEKEYLKRDYNFKNMTNNEVKRRVEFLEGMKLRLQNSLEEKKSYKQIQHRRFMIKEINKKIIEGKAIIK